jgi:hypothetical protein
LIAALWLLHFCASSPAGIFESNLKAISLYFYNST